MRWCTIAALEYDVQLEALMSIIEMYDVIIVYILRTTALIFIRLL
jgi:hypothetical protein